MKLLPEELQKNLMIFIQANPSPNVPVGECMKLYMQLQNLKNFGDKRGAAAPGTPTIVPKPEDEGPVVPGGGDADEEQPAEESEVSNG